MKVYDSTKWSKADTGFVVFIILVFVLYEIVSAEASAAEFVYELPSNPVTIEFDPVLKVNGRHVDLLDLKCPDVPEYPKGFNPSACPKGWTCTPAAGSEARKIREDEMEKYTGSRMPYKKSRKPSSRKGGRGE